MLGETRSIAAVEFAIVGPLFLVMLFFIFALSAALFQQEALDSGLHVAVRQVQTGNAQNLSGGKDFITNYLCPNVQGLLNCDDLYVKVETLTFPTLQDDFYSAGCYAKGAKCVDNTTGLLPETNGSLDLSLYSSTLTVGATNFCNSTPSSYLLVTAIYVSPAIVPGLLGNILSVASNGARVHATMSQVATYTEAYPAVAPSGSGTVAPSC